VGDPGPLARGEHIVYLSAFFNVEARAIQWYNKVSEYYTEKAAGVGSEPAQTAPRVVWLTYHSDGTMSGYTTPDGKELGTGPVIVVSFARYKTILTRDAGGALPSQSAVVNATGAFASGDDVVFASSEYSSRQQQLTAVGQVLKDVDVLIDESFEVTTAVRRVPLCLASGM
jgi:hypothetical protein